MAEPETFDHVQNTAEAAFANDVLRRIAGDAIYGGESETLVQVLEKHAERFELKADDGKVDWDKLSDKLIKGLNHLLPDKAVKDAEGKVKIDTKVDLTDEVQKALKELMTADPARSIQDMAAEMSRKNLQLDKANPSKEESLVAFLYRTTPDGSTFAAESVEEILRALKSFLNQFEPGLGDLVEDIFGRFGAQKPETEADNLKEHAKDMYRTMGRGERAFAEYQGFPERPEVDPNDPDAPRDYNNLEIPIHDPAFFGAGSGGTYTLGFGADQREFEALNFEKLFLDRLTKPENEGGLGYFTFENDQAKEQFIQYMKVAWYGGQLDGDFVDSLTYKETADPVNGRISLDGVLQFSGAGREAFGAFVKSIDMGHADHDRYGVADKIIDWVNQNGSAHGVHFVRDGQVIDIPSSGEAKDIHSDYAEKQNYNHVKRELMSELVDYEKVGNEKEWAERLERGMALPGVKPNIEVAPQKDIPSVGVARTSDSVAAAPTAAASQTTAENTLSQYNPVPTGDGVPSIESGDTSDNIVINGNQVSGSEGQFATYASGSNAVKVGPDMDVSADVDLERGPANDGAHSLTA